MAMPIQQGHERRTAGAPAHVGQLSRQVGRNREPHIRSRERLHRGLPRLDRAARRDPEHPRLGGLALHLRITKAREQHLLRVTQLAHAYRYQHLKLYMMVGLPSETDDDIDELCRFAGELSAIHPLALGIAPFVAKRNTPLDGEPFAGIKPVEQRLKRLRRGLHGRVDVRATSARWAWVEYVLAQGGPPEGLAVMHAVRAGGRFADYERAFAALPAERPRRALRVVA